MFLKGVIIINNNEFDDNMSLILDLYKEIDDLRQNKDSLEYQFKIEKTNEIIKKFEELIDIVGRDKFEFNDDGSFFYIWKGNNKNE